MRPLAIDLFTGLHGWSEGLVAEGFRVIGFDIEDMCAQFNQPRPEHVELVLEDVLTLDGARFKDAALIVASPPCQAYSYMAMPWSLAKAKAAAIRADETGTALEQLNALFNACFRIQREASEAAGRHIPLVVENVRGAIPWVGRSRWNFGSYHLWGDVPALMPMTLAATNEGRKNDGGSWFKIGGPAQKVTGQNPDSRNWTRDKVASCASGSKARKQASAQIAKIPLPLSAWIARHYLPAPEHQPPQKPGLTQPRQQRNVRSVGSLLQGSTHGPDG